MQNNSFSWFNFFRTAFLVTVTMASSWVQARQEIAKINTRDNAFMIVLADVPENLSSQQVRHVLIQVIGENGTGVIRGADGAPVHGVIDAPFTRVRAQLVQRGMVLISPQAPSDQPQGIKFESRYEMAHLQDIASMVKAARVRFPGAQIHLVGYNAMLASLLAYANRPLEPVDSYIVVGGFWQLITYPPASTLITTLPRQPWLVLQAANHRCGPSSNFDAKQAAERNGFTYVEVGYGYDDKAVSCRNHNLLEGVDEAFVRTMSQWLDHQRVPARIGDLSTTKDVREEMISYTAPDDNGELRRLQMNVMWPAGPGPFPVIVHNHGDLSESSPLVNQAAARFRNYALADNFLQMGFAVAMPARAGVGGSEGRYSVPNSKQVGNSIFYKARDVAKQIVPAVETLLKNPRIRKESIFLSGQSSGGYASMYIASMRPSWLRGVINFSGGRTTTDIKKIAKDYNNIMIEGYQIMGQTSQVPTYWVFAENDSRYSRETIIASYNAYIGSGGRAELFLNPAIEGDGHQIMEKPELWRDRVQQFLRHTLSDGYR